MSARRVSRLSWTVSHWDEKWIGRPTAGCLKALRFFFPLLFFSFFFLHVNEPSHFCEIKFCCCHIFLNDIKSCEGEMSSQRWGIHYCASQMYSKFLKWTQYVWRVEGVGGGSTVIFAFSWLGTKVTNTTCHWASRLHFKQYYPLSTKVQTRYIHSMCNLHPDKIQIEKDNNK